MASNDNDRAKEHFRRGLEKFEDDDYDGAIAEFNESLRFSPRLVPVLNIHGLCRALKDEQDKAIRDFNEAIGSDLCDPHTWSNRGNSWGRANTTRRFWTMTKRSGWIHILRIFGRTEAMLVRIMATLREQSADFDMDDRNDALSLRNCSLHTDASAYGRQNKKSTVRERKGVASGSRDYRRILKRLPFC